MDLSGLAGKGGNDWARAEQILRDAGIRDYSSGLRNFVLTGDQGYSYEDAQRYGLPMGNRLVEKQAGESARQAAEQQGRVTEFTGRVQSQIPAALSALEERSGLPEARATYLSAGQQAQTTANKIRDVAPRQQTLAKQGFGISSPRLQARIAHETSRYQPELETATRGLESAQLGLSSATGQYQTGAEGIYMPFQIEAGILGDNVRSQFELIKQNTQNATSRAIAELQERGTSDRAALERASTAAIAEKQLLSGSWEDAGDRLVNTSTGQVILKGLTPSKGTTSGKPKPPI